MHPFLHCVPTLLVSTIYCLWGQYARVVAGRHRQLRERVAYMLWVMAEQVG